MNIQQIEYLIAVDKYKHFGKAAQACFVTQPTLSAMIQKLEEELEVKIFDRSSHPIRTTDIGMEIVRQAKLIMDSIMELKNKVNLLNNTLAGNLSLGIIPTISDSILSNDFFDFLIQNPKIDISIREMNSDNIIKNLKSGEIDAGIISTPYENTSEFFSDFLFNEELFVYSSSESPEKPKYINPKELNINKIWLLEEGNCLRRQTETVCHLQENILKPKNLEYHASNNNTLINLVDRLGGITIIPELSARKLCCEQAKNVFQFQKPFPAREISLIYYKPSYKQRMLDELANFIKTSLAPKLNFNQNPKDYSIIKP
ncbi:MAG: LysR substrate-binding domain-containing protein [Flavobacteriaceae bacterium]|nr:LysR substrate-binding domain-containing protein [Flavobacteriaceae bacterium]